jgi:hypothetical protein
MVTQVNRADKFYFSDTYWSHLCKYADRGFEIYFPEVLAPANSVPPTDQVLYWRQAFFKHYEDIDLYTAAYPTEIMAMIIKSLPTEKKIYQSSPSTDAFRYFRRRRGGRF